MPKTILILFLLYSVLSLVLSSPCTEVINPSSYQDCMNYSDAENETICCYIIKDKGEDSQKVTSCVDMDQIFDGRVMDFSNSVISGKLNCNTEEVSSSMLVSLSNIMLLISLVLVL